MVAEASYRLVVDDYGSWPTVHMVRVGFLWPQVGDIQRSTLVQPNVAVKALAQIDDGASRRFERPAFYQA